MKPIYAAAAAMALVAGAADAAGVERTTQSIAILFEQGNYAELSFGSVRPEVSGIGALATPGIPSGDMAGDFTQLAMGVKTALSQNLDFALIFDKPFGADVNYPLTGYYAQGSVAELDAVALTAVARYRFASNFSVIGGLRHQTLSASASVPFVAGYSVTGAQDSGLGYLIGAAYERPDIALRVALTYNSKVRHKLPTIEAGLAGPVTEVDTPQSLNLEFQSGVAKDTLVFGSVRWVDWSAFEIDPAKYPPPQPLVFYDHDTVTYTIGLGRRFSDTWSGAISFAYEPQNGGFSSNLGPNDGRRSVTVGATYTKERLKISGGVIYVDIGDARTQAGPVAPAGVFTRNHAVGVGLKAGYWF